MMTMYDPVFPTVKQIVNSVKNRLRTWQLRRTQNKRSVHVSELPEHLRDDLDLGALTKSRSSIRDYH